MMRKHYTCMTLTTTIFYRDKNVNSQVNPDLKINKIDTVYIKIASHGGPVREDMTDGRVTVHRAAPAPPLFHSRRPQRMHNDLIRHKCIWVR